MFNQILLENKTKLEFCFFSYFTAILNFIEEKKSTNYCYLVLSKWDAIAVVMNMVDLPKW